jgi:hypothetical protein
LVVAEMWMKMGSGSSCQTFEPKSSISHLKHQWISCSSIPSSLDTSRWW